MQNKKEIFGSEWQDFSKVIEEGIKQYEESYQKLWDSFDSDDKLKLFCAVISKLYKGELEDKGSYRYILYNVFGFGPEAYGTAQAAGFLGLHNAIMNEDDYAVISNKIAKFSEENNISKEKSEEFIENLLRNFRI